MDKNLLNQMNETELQELLSIKEDLKELNNKLDNLFNSVNNRLDNNLSEPIKLSKIESEDKIIEEQKEILQPIPIFTPISDVVEDNKGNNFTPLPINNVKRDKKKSSLESNIGKNVMGVLASILIFIGLISLAFFVLEEVSDVVKQIFMYLFSFGLTTVGIWRVYKKKNGFSLSVSGCGIGSVFISILLSCFYFQSITNEFLLFALLIGWSAVVLVLSKKFKSDLFVIISYIGVLISLYLGLLSDIELFGFKTITSAILLLLHLGFSSLISLKGIEVSKILYKVFPFIFSLNTLIMSSTVSVPYIPLDEGSANLGINILVVVSILHLIMNLKNIYYFDITGKANSVYLGIITVIYGIIDCCFIGFSVETINCAITDNILLDMVILYLLSYFILSFILKWQDRRVILFNVVGGFISFILPIFLLCGVVYTPIIKFVGMLIPAIILLIFGKNNKNISWMSLFYYLFGIIAGAFHILDAENLIAFVVFTVLHIAYLGYYTYKVKENYSILSKVVLYYLSLCAVVILPAIFVDLVEIEMGTLEIEGFLYYLIIVLFGLFIKMTSFCQNWSQVKSIVKEKEVETDVLYSLNNGTNLILLFIGIGLFEVFEGTILFLPMIVLTSLLCFTGCMDILRFNNKLGGWYLGIKFTLYLNYVLSNITASDMGYLNTILCFVIAVVSIILGFKYLIKSFRLYGLLLSIGSVLKLILIDISYDNSLARIFSFIISGLLCFLIVWIYNKMSDKLSIAESDDTNLIE